MAITLKVSGRSLSVKAPPETPLLWVLPDELHMASIKIDCSIAS